MQSCRPIHHAFVQPFGDGALAIEPQRGLARLLDRRDQGGALGRTECEQPMLGDQVLAEVADSPKNEQREGFAQFNLELAARGIKQAVAQFELRLAECL